MSDIAIYRQRWHAILSAMPIVTFEGWVKAVFDHPLLNPEWYWANDFYEHWGDLGLSELLTVEYMNRLFLATDCLKDYSLEQVAQGIWFLIGESSPAQSVHALLASEVPLQQRIGCV